MKQTYKILLLSIVAICAAVGVHAQSKQVDISISFRQGRGTIDLDYNDNKAKLDRVIFLLDSINKSESAYLNSIEFSGAASPEGSAEINRRLSRQRVASIENYVRSRVAIPEAQVIRNDQYIAWGKLAKLVEQSDMMDKQEVLRILNTDYGVAKDANGKEVDGRIVELKKLNNGITWKVLFARFFSELRNGSAAGVSFEARRIAGVDIFAEVKPMSSLPELETSKCDVASQRPVRHIYLKTNIIGWGMSVANVAVEFDMGNKWSAQIPIYYSAVDYFTSTLKFRTFCIQPEVRYWFSGNMNDKFFMGAHFGMGYYNFAVDGKYRIQDKDGDSPALGGGLSLGYRWPIGNSGRWKMEFSVGAGAYSVKYDKFYNTDKVANGALSQTVDKTWIGLDHAALSFSYMFNIKRKNQ